MVTTLIAKKLIKPIGQKEVPGRPTLYGTTSEFLIHFGLNKLSDLPLPGEVKELNFENLDDLKFRDEFNTPEIDEFPPLPPAFVLVAVATPPAPTVIV